MTADTLCAMLGVQEVTAALHTRRLRWFGHVTRSSSCTNFITSMTIHSELKHMDYIHVQADKSPTSVYTLHITGYFVLKLVRVVKILVLVSNH